MTHPAGGYSAAFNAAVLEVLKAEGGYQNDPEDRGNWTGGAKGVGENKGTHWGISAAKYPDLDIRSLTRDDAVAIYHRDYWRPVRGDEVPYRLALVLFDIQVNGGHPVTWLQQALGVTADGVFGPATLAAIGRAGDPKALVGRVLRRRVLYYTTLGTFERYGPTWIQRSFDLHRAALEATLP